MKKILFMLLCTLLVFSIFTTGCQPCMSYLAPIEDIAIWANGSLPSEYFLYVVNGLRSRDDFSRYEVTPAGNTTILVEIFNGTCYPYDPVDRYATHNISLGSDFVPGVHYTVDINRADLTVTFVAGVMIYLAPIHDIEIWAGESSPSQYFVDVVSGEPSICDHFNSYNVTRAGNTTVIIEIFNLRCGTGCPDVYSYVENTIPIGSDFVLGGNYTVVVNNVTENFVA